MVEVQSLVTMSYKYRNSANYQWALEMMFGTQSSIGEVYTIVPNSAASVRLRCVSSVHFRIGYFINRSSTTAGLILTMTCFHALVSTGSTLRNQYHDDFDLIF